MLTQIALCLIPICVMGAFAYHNKRSFTILEYAVGIVVGLALAVGGYQYARHMSVMDTETATSWPSWTPS